jgi:hypothetical protein
MGSELNNNVMFPHTYALYEAKYNY